LTFTKVGPRFLLRFSALGRRYGREPVGPASRCVGLVLTPVVGVIYKWGKVGRLPRGLKLSSATGVISGTTGKATGTFMFTVRLTDKAKPKGLTTKVFSITVK
jgi:hypothetical protein